MLIPPPILTYVQTSGSFHKVHPKARVAAIINAPSDIYRYMIPVDANSTTEAEWASVLFGLTMAIERSCEVIVIEHKHSGIIRSLMMPRPRLRHEYAQFYHNQIITRANETTWTGVRWQNHADTLLQ